MALFDPKVKQAKLSVLQRLAGNMDGPKPLAPGRPVRMLRKQEVREIDKPMSFKEKKLKPIY